MTDAIVITQRPDPEEIDAPDDTPSPGDYMELRITETIRSGERDENGMPEKYHFFYTDADGPATSVETVPDKYSEGESADRVTRWVFVAVTHVGSNYLLLADLHGHSFRVHLDTWRERCRLVADPDARIRSSVRIWQDRLTDATRKIGQLMQAIGVEGRQIAPDTQALAVSVGVGDADTHKAALVETREQLPALYKVIEGAGKNMGKWMAARALPMRSMARSMSDRQDSIDSRLLAVDLYTGLSEDAVCCRKGKPAEFHDKLHLMQRMHYMDEECLVDYQHGGMDFKSIGHFDRWLARRSNFERLLPHPRCAVAFRVRRYRKHRPMPESIGGFLQLWQEENDDRRTYLYVRNGKQLWRVECKHDFGEDLFPDMAHSTLSAGEPLWANPNGCDMRTEGDMEQQYGADPVEWHGYEPFNDSSVYYDDIKASLDKMMAEYNRVAVLLQGLLDRSPVFHPHPPIRLWAASDFDAFVTLVFDKDRALVSGPAPDFDAYRAGLADSIRAGSHTIGQEDLWWNRAREKENDRRDRGSYSSRDRNIYSDNTWWWPEKHDPGPGFISKVTGTRGAACRFGWERRAMKQRPGSDPWDDNYPTVKDSIRVDRSELFNVSKYKPGDYKMFFADPRTRADYLEWAPILLAAEEFHAQGCGEYSAPLGGRRR